MTKLYRQPNIKTLLTTLILAILCLQGPAQAEEAYSPAAVVEVNPSKIRQISDTVFSGGQPTTDEFLSLKEKGIKTVINLRPASETDQDEQALMSELGIRYVNLPIMSASDINLSNAKALTDLIQQNGDEPLLVHCGSGNRVGALIATAENKIKQNSIDDSIEVGKKWGLTGLEPNVRKLLTNNSDVE